MPTHERDRSSRDAVPFDGHALQPTAHSEILNLLHQETGGKRMPTGDDVRKLAATLVTRRMAHSTNQAERLIGSAVQALAIHHGGGAGKRFLSGNFSDEDTAPTGMEMESDDDAPGAPLGSAPVVKQSQTRKDGPGALGAASPKARSAAAAAANPTGPSGTQMGSSSGVEATGGSGMHKKKGLTIHIVRGPRGGFYEVTQNHGYRRISQEEYESRMGAVQGQSAGEGDDVEEHDAQDAEAHGLPRFHSSNVEGGRSAMHPAEAADEALGEEADFAHRHGGAITTPSHHHEGKTNLTVNDVASHIAHLAEFDAGDGIKGHRLTWIGQPIKRDGQLMNSGSHSIDFDISERDGGVHVQPLLLTYLGKHRLSAKQIAFLIATGKIHPKDAQPDHVDAFGDPTLLTPDELQRGDMGQVNQMMAHLVSYAEHMRGTAVNAALSSRMGENDHWRKEQQFAHFAPPPKGFLAKSISPMVAAITRASHPLHPRLPGGAEPHITAGIRVPKGHTLSRVVRTDVPPVPRAPRLTATPTPYGSVNGGDPSWEVDMAAYDGTASGCTAIVAQLLTEGHVGIDDVARFVAAHRWRYALVPSALIHIDPANRDLDPAKIATIREEIHDGKRMPPLIAVDSVNGGYDLKDGHHRYTGEVMEGRQQHRLFCGSPRKNR